MEPTIAEQLGIIDERDDAAWESWIENATKHDIEWLRELAIQHLAQQADVEHLGAELEKVRGLLREAPVSPHNAFNTHWLERVEAVLATEVKP